MDGGIPLKSMSVAFTTHCGKQTYICVPHDTTLHFMPVLRLQLLCHGSTSVKWVLHRRYFYSSPATRPWRQRLLHLEARSQPTRRIRRTR